MKTMACKTLRAFILLAAVLLVALALYVAYLFLSYSRLPDMLPLAAENNPSAVAQTGTEYTLLSFNIGFGAYEPDFGFFMDGGKESRAFSKERLLANLANIEAFLQAQDADFLLIQETDEDGTRTYHVNEREALTNALGGYASVWAQNWDSAYLFYPFLEPHGKNVAGLMTFSRFGVSSALRRSLPIETGYMKLLDLDRCYSVSRIPLESGAELVLYNVHLSAYTSDGTIADEQLDLLIADMAAEYAAGNYAVCGGDFNKDVPGNSPEIFGTEDSGYTWAQPLPREKFAGTGLALVAPVGETQPVPSCRNADSPYHEGQYVVTVDGFIVSENVHVLSGTVLDTGFAYSDHNPVRMVFSLAEQ